MRVRNLLLSATLLAMTTAASGCQRGSGGPLTAVAGKGVVVEGDHSAVVSDAGLVARIAGRWSSRGENNLRITYRNSGPTVRTIPLTGMRMTHPGGDAVVTTAVDATGIDLADARTDNDSPRLLYDVQKGNAAPGTLVVPPGATREVDVELTGFENEGSVAVGDSITVTVPTGRHAAHIGFVAAQPPGLPF